MVLLAIVNMFLLLLGFLTSLRKSKGANSDRPETSPAFNQITGSHPGSTPGH
ncbi:MAG: hypothetical protein WB952_21020 [Terriglobales bacterium]